MDRFWLDYEDYEDMDYYYFDDGCPDRLTIEDLLEPWQYKSEVAGDTEEQEAQAEVRRPCKASNSGLDRIRNIGMEPERIEDTRDPIIR